jgi:hypothetical protein
VSSLPSWPRRKWHRITRCDARSLSLSLFFFFFFLFHPGLVIVFWIHPLMAHELRGPMIAALRRITLAVVTLPCR